MSMLSKLVIEGLWLRLSTGSGFLTIDQQISSEATQNMSQNKAKLISIMKTVVFSEKQLCKVILMKAELTSAMVTR